MCIALVTMIIWLISGREHRFSRLQGVYLFWLSAAPVHLVLATPVAIMVGSGKGAKTEYFLKQLKALKLPEKPILFALIKQVR